MSDELILNGAPATPGIAIGKVFLYRHDVPEFRSYCVVERHRPEEIARLNEAIKLSTRQLAVLCSSLEKQVGEAVARIFEAQSVILEDDEFLGEIRAVIVDDGLNAEFAVQQTSSLWFEKLSKLDDELFRQRAQDIRDVGIRLIKTLIGSGETALGPVDEEAILVADDLLPSDVVRLSSQKILGVATDHGAATSHTAILTRSLEVPAVVGLKNLSRQVQNGDLMVLSGNRGIVIIHPSEATLAQYREKRSSYVAFLHGLKDIIDLPAATTDGVPITLRANIELPREAEAAAYYGAEGIGLFRSEYLFLARQKLPTEEEQYADYCQVIGTIAPHPVTIRTFDLGGDKVFADMPHPAEANPFMGWRAIRVSLSQTALFRTQLRAILRAAVMGQVRMLFPFVTCVGEVRLVREHIQEAARELTRAGIEHNPNIPLGIMIEIPSAALLADSLAREADFFSIGTNDLTQFTLAVDRTNERVEYLYRPLHPALLRLIKIASDAGKQAGIPVGLCGEMGANPLAVMILVGLGVNELSVSPVTLPQVKKLIRSMSFQDAVSVAKAALDVKTANELLEFCQREMKARFAGLPIWNNGW